MTPLQSRGRVPLFTMCARAYVRVSLFIRARSVGRATEGVRERNERGERSRLEQLRPDNFVGHGTFLNRAQTGD